MRSAVLFSVLFLTSSAWAATITILEPADSTQPIQVSFTGFLAGATVNAGTESVVFDGYIGDGSEIGPFIYNLWMLESGGLTNNFGIISGLVSDTVRMELGPTLIPQLGIGTCPDSSVQTCRTVHLEFESLHPATVLFTIPPTFGPYDFNAVQEVPGVMDLSAYFGGIGVFVQSDPLPAPVPEPSTLTLLGGGLAGLAGLIRRRR